MGVAGVSVGGQPPPDGVVIRTSEDRWMQENRPMTALRRALIGLGALAFAIGIGGAILALGSDHNTVRGANAALVLVIGWGFVGTGLYAWDRRPGNGIGPLMTAAGFSAFLMALRFSNDALVFTTPPTSTPLSSSWAGCC
jgi:hypothetical protein